MDRLLVIYGISCGQRGLLNSPVHWLGDVLTFMTDESCLRLCEPVLAVMLGFRACHHSVHGHYRTLRRSYPLSLLLEFLSLWSSGMDGLGVCSIQNNYKEYFSSCSHKHNSSPGC